MDISKLKSKLNEHLTVHQCYEIARVVGLFASSLCEIKYSKDSVNVLIDMLYRSGRINSSDISALMFALEKCGLRYLIDLIKASDDLHIDDSKSETAVFRKYCICLENSFEQLKSENDETRIVSFRCSSCLSEWCHSSLISEDTSQNEIRWTLLRGMNNDEFVYQTPFELNLSELSNEVVADINELRRGDHIIFRRFWGSYDHHAILVEVDSGKLKVIEWTSGWGNWKLCASIKVGNVIFPRGGVIRRNYKNSDHADVVIARAFDMMKHSKEKYDIFENNCETLATYCKVGKGISIQGKVLKDILPPPVRGLARILGGALIKK